MATSSIRPENGNWIDQFAAVPVPIENRPEGAVGAVVLVFDVATPLT